MRLPKIAMSGLFSLAIVPIFSLAIAPIAGMALTFGDSGWTMLIGVGAMFLVTGIVIAVHMARSKREFRYAQPEAGSEKISNQLVALSSAAILAVYAAGYFHTRTAADRFLAEAVEQRTAAVATSPLPPATAPESAPADAEPSTRASASASSSHASPRSGSKAASQSGAKPSRDVAPRAAPSSSAGSSAGAASNPQPSVSVAPPDTPAASSNSPASAPAPAATPPPSTGTATASSGDKADQANSPAASAAPAPSAPTPAQPTPMSPAATPAPAAAMTPTTAPAQPAQARYKDGTYQGWGTCRHGDIQATVVIDGGKIASADISKCYTRYPCDIVSQLPGQVVSRQSISVDYVSGATQSVYAFQQAVSAALAMAKGK